VKLDFARYINARGEQCPDCGGATKFESPEITTLGLIYRNTRCVACNAIWITQYQIMEYTNFRKGKVKKK